MKLSAKDILDQPQCKDVTSPYHLVSGQAHPVIRFPTYVDPSKFANVPPSSLSVFRTRNLQYEFDYTNLTSHADPKGTLRCYIEWNYNPPHSWTFSARPTATAPKKGKAPKNGTRFRPCYPLEGDLFRSARDGHIFRCRSRGFHAIEQHPSSKQPEAPVRTPQDPKRRSSERIRGLTEFTHETLQKSKHEERSPSQRQSRQRIVPSVTRSNKATSSSRLPDQAPLSGTLGHNASAIPSRDAEKRKTSEAADDLSAPRKHARIPRPVQTQDDTDLSQGHSPNMAPETSIDLDASIKVTKDPRVSKRYNLSTAPGFKATESLDESGGDGLNTPTSSPSYSSDLESEG